MRPRIVGLGELLWDILPDSLQMGGAPANFAYHAAALGCHAKVVSRVGADELGHRLITRLEGLGLATDAIESDAKRPTGTVTVEVQHDGQPEFTIHENVAWDYIMGSDAALAAVKESDAVCFGSLAQRCETSRNAIRSLIRAAPAGVLRIFDINLRQRFYSKSVIEGSLALANVLKVNETELPVLAHLFDWQGDVRTVIQRVADQFELQTVAYTRGAEGSLVWSGGHWSDHPGVPVQVVDTVGAGDSFTAMMVFGLLSRWSLDELNHRANSIASYVASCPGATPELPQSLLCFT